MTQNFALPAMHSRAINSLPDSWTIRDAIVVAAILTTPPMLVLVAGFTSLPRDLAVVQPWAYEQILWSACAFVAAHLGCSLLQRAAISSRSRTSATWLNLFAMAVLIAGLIPMVLATVTLVSYFGDLTAALTLTAAPR